MPAFKAWSTSLLKKMEKEKFASSSFCDEDNIQRTECRVFVMRHMEAEARQVLKKMVLIRIKEKKEKLLKEADAYVKQQRKSSQLLTDDKFRLNGCL